MTTSRRLSDHATVPSKDNPADLLSCGVRPSTLPHTDLWWNGPSWLQSSPSEWPSQPQLTLKSLPELRAQVLLIPSTRPDKFWDRYSSFTYLVRVVAWIRRFFHNVKHSRSERISEAVLTSAETLSSKLQLFRLSQHEVYPEVFDALVVGKKLPKSHSLSAYDVSLEADCLLRVSGRVRQRENKHQLQSLVPLSLKSYLTCLFITSFHSINSHPGVSSMLCLLAGEFHIPGLKRFLKHLSRRCVICQKAYARPLSQQMGMLPAVRTTPASPFTSTGLDFAGPVQIRQGYTR